MRTSHTDCAAGTIQWVGLGDGCMCMYTSCMRLLQLPPYSNFLQKPPTDDAMATGEGEGEGQSLDSMYHDAVSEERLLDLSPQQTTPTSCQRDHGLVLIELAQLSVFGVAGYLGNRSHDYFCAQVSSRGSCVEGSAQCHAVCLCHFVDLSVICLHA